MWTREAAPRAARAREEAVGRVPEAIDHGRGDPGRPRGWRAAPRGTPGGGGPSSRGAVVSGRGDDPALVGLEDADQPVALGPLAIEPGVVAAQRLEALGAEAGIVGRAVGHLGPRPGHERRLDVAVEPSERRRRLSPHARLRRTRPTQKIVCASGRRGSRPRRGGTSPRGTGPGTCAGPDACRRRPPRPRRPPSIQLACNNRAAASRSRPISGLTG